MAAIAPTNDIRRVTRDELAPSRLLSAWAGDLYCEATIVIKWEREEKIMPIS